ncbi:MAG: cytochrome c biogenesis protein CcsA [Bacteroidales bacterium]
MNIQYIGEHLVAGYLGRIFIWASFLSLIISAVLYVYAINKADRQAFFTKLASNFFWLHFLSLLGAIASLYYLIGNHYFEYSYVYQYSSADMQKKFIVSCFWAGQEGSYLVWAFWQGIIGLMLVRSLRDWKPWVMPVFASGQFFLVSMVLGLDLGAFSIGGSPFELLRNMPSNASEEFFKDPNYVKFLTDGNGLNPLLENIWMIIHPPSLFLGYAVALVPFSFAIASLWRKEYHSWLKPAIPWTIASVLTLGIGIILGGRWAYESLTFGGFWAWDPVENASLVPWLLLIASLHSMVITAKRFNTYATTYFLTILGWFFVMYATYLTRSGILGETSVHSFGANALATQMAFFTALFLILPSIFILVRRKYFAKKESDEVMTREFWMLIGAIVVLLSAFQVIATTSIPVFNKIFGTEIAPPIDNVNFYNTWQMPFAIVIALGIAISQYLWYGPNDVKKFLKSISIASAIAVVLTILIAVGDHVTGTSRIVLLFSILLASVVSVDFVIRYIKKTSNVGGALSHVGFMLFLLGVVLAFSNSQVISIDSSANGADSETRDNIILVKGIGKPMGRYMVTYTEANTIGRETFYKVDFVKMKDAGTGKVDFTLHPSLNRNERMGNVYNPDTKHFIDKDIYTFLSFAQQSGDNADVEGFSKSGEQTMDVKDTLMLDRSFVILDEVKTSMENNDVNNASITAHFKIISMKGGQMETEVKYEIINGELKQTDGMIAPLNLKLRFEGVSTDSKAINIGVYEKQQDYIVMKAIIFPFMAVLWFGVVVLFSALTYAIMRRTMRKTKELEVK